MKLNIQHLVLWIVGFGGACAVAYEGFAKTGQPLTLTALVGVVMTAIALFVAILSKGAFETQSTGDVLHALSVIFQQLAQALPQPSQAPGFVFEPGKPCPVCSQPLPSSPAADPSPISDAAKKVGAAVTTILFIIALGAISTSTTGCKLLQKDPQFVQDSQALTKCVGDEIQAGNTDALTIAAKCFNGELKLAYDFIAGLLDLPSFVAAMPQHHIAALKLSHASLGAQLAEKR